MTESLAMPTLLFQTDLTIGGTYGVECKKQGMLIHIIQERPASFINWLHSRSLQSSSRVIVRWQNQLGFCGHWLPIAQLAALLLTVRCSIRIHATTMIRKLVFLDSRKNDIGILLCLSITCLFP